MALVEGVPGPAPGRGVRGYRRSSFQSWGPLPDEASAADAGVGGEGPTRDHLDRPWIPTRTWAAVVKGRRGREGEESRDADTRASLGLRGKRGYRVSIIIRASSPCNNEDPARG